MRPGCASRTQNSSSSLPSVRQPGLLADSCAHYLIIDGGERQRVLETLNVAERVKLCTEALAMQQAMLTGPGTLH